MYDFVDEVGFVGSNDFIYGFFEVIKDLCYLLLMFFILFVLIMVWKSLIDNFCWCGVWNWSVELVRWELVFIDFGLVF